MGKLFPGGSLSPTQGVALGYNIAPLWGFKMPNLMAVTRRVGTRDVFVPKQTQPLSLTFSRWERGTK
jgi:hypothetical protein